MRIFLKEPSRHHFFGKTSYLEKSILEDQEKKAHSLILLLLAREVLYDVLEEQTIGWL